MRNTFIAAALLSSIAGCASWTTPRPAPAAVEVPAAWSTTPPAQTREPDSMAQWWLRFHDPLLVELVGDALRSNTDIKSATAALRQARSLRDVARGALFPQVTANAGARRGQVAGAALSNVFSASTDAAWELDLFGYNRSALHVSDALAQASAANLDAVRTSIAAEVALAYITLRSSQTRLAIAADNLASQRETLQITQWRLQAGLVTSLEAEQARSAAEQTSAQLPLLRTAVTQTGHALAVLTGRPPAALTPMLAEAGPVPVAAAELTLNLPTEVLRQRPDVRYAERQVAAAMARVEQARSARAPDFSLGGSLGVQAASVNALSRSAAVVKAVISSLSLPLFDGGARRAQVRAQRAALEQTQAAYEAAVLLALLEVEDSLAALRDDRERTARLQQASEAAGHAALLARQRFSSGLTDFQTVLETQRTQLSTQDTLASAAASASSDQVRLFKALGGTWP